MTTKNLEQILNSGSIEPKKAEKLKIVYDATNALTSDVRRVLLNKQNIMHEQTFKFLKHKNFRNALLESIFYTLELKEIPHHLKRSELTCFTNKTYSKAQYLEVCEKLTNGIVHAIGVSDEDDDTINIMLQEILSHYMDELEKELNV